VLQLLVSVARAELGEQVVVPRRQQSSIYSLAASILVDTLLVFSSVQGNTYLPD
jgi:hypothetical protein